MQIGFVGRVTYGFEGDDVAMRGQLNALADLVFYAGGGYKTTMGMGQMQRLPEREGPSPSRTTNTGRKRHGKEKTR